jgi:hypothetical protein
MKIEIKITQLGDDGGKIEKMEGLTIVCNFIDGTRYFINSYFDNLEERLFKWREISYVTVGRCNFDADCGQENVLNSCNRECYEFGTSQAFFNSKVDNGEMTVTEFIKHIRQFNIRGILQISC